MDLRKDQNIVIVPADKGRATVILNRDEYIQKVREVIDDISKYRILRRDPIVKTENRISDALVTLQSAPSAQQSYHKVTYTDAAIQTECSSFPTLESNEATLKIANQASLLHAATHSGSLALVQWLVIKYGLEVTITKISVIINQLEMSCGNVLFSLVLPSTGWWDSA